MDIAAVRAALGMAPQNVRVGNTQLNCTRHTPNSVTVPAWYPTTVALDYASDKGTFNGEPVIEANCLVLTAPEANPEEGQALLDAYLSDGPTSIKAALEADLTLGGVCQTLHVHTIDGYQLYTVGLATYYGARFRVLILG